MQNKYFYKVDLQKRIKCFTFVKSRIFSWQINSIRKYSL